MLRKNNYLVMAVTLVLLLGMNVSAFASNSGYPVMITSAGQGPDGLIVKVLLDRELQEKGIQASYEQSATAADLEGINTLLVAIGVSSKGLGAAGININDELARVESVLKQAKDQGSNIVFVHSGGSGRRGSQTDSMMNSIISYADQVVVLKGGNEDGFFTKLGEKTGTPVTIVDTRNELGVLIADILDGK